MPGTPPARTGSSLTEVASRGRNRPVIAQLDHLQAVAHQARRQLRGLVPAGQLTVSFELPAGAGVSSSAPAGSAQVDLLRGERVAQLLPPLDA